MADTIACRRLGFLVITSLGQNRRFGENASVTKVVAGACLLSA